MPSPAESVRHTLAQRTGTDAADWHLVFKARYGMEVLFRALADIHGGGSVATQIFTCATAVDPIVVAGLRPAYAEVSPDSVAIDPHRLDLAADTRAVVLQHTFGIVDEDRARRLRDAADRAGALLVEDSAHCATRMARGPDGLLLADVSVHSFGAEKLLPTRFGGAIWVNPRMDDSAVRFRLQRQLASLPTVGRRVDLTARAYLNQNRVLNRLPGAVSRPARSVLTTAGLFEPLIAPVETRGGLRYAAMAPSPWMVAQVAAQLPRIDEVERTRAAAVATYLGELEGVVQIPSAVRPDSPLVRFPFFVPEGADAEQVVAAVTAAGFYGGRWYRPAFFPGAADPSAYGWTPGDPALATTEDLIARVVNLPTNVSPQDAHRAAAVVRELISGGAAKRI